MAQSKNDRLGRSGNANCVVGRDGQLAAGNESAAFGAGDKDVADNGPGPTTMPDHRIAPGGPVVVNRECVGLDPGGGLTPLASLPGLQSRHFRLEIE